MHDRLVRSFRALIACAGLLASAVVLSATKAPEFRDVTVHDPSVIRSGDHVYIFGSHLAVAKTKDLMRWSLVAEGVRPANPLFRNVETDLAEAFAWSGVTALWAPDVTRLADGRYAMYYDTCQGDAPRSALGLAVSRSIEGPYRNEGILLKSGMWGEPGESGDIYDARIHPNTVDPAVFTDARGRMWMVYGSYSGGIFILRIDAKTGRPLAGQGYGKRLMGGNHSRIEAPFIHYNPKTRYYYLYISYGGLSADGGYNIRVARSLQPDGPYRDAAGYPMTGVKADPTRPLFDDRSIEPYGVTLMGGFVFDRRDGEPSDDVGYVSPGHNSVLRQGGKEFLVFHTRFPGRGEMHQVRVHQILMNAAAWPVVAPYRYAGEKADRVSNEDITGEYMLVKHSRPIAPGARRSERIRLEADGRITGAASGAWRRTGDHGARLVLNGAECDGVFLRQWDPASFAQVMTFTALTKEGVSVWGSRLPPKASHLPAQLS